MYQPGAAGQQEKREKRGQTVRSMGVLIDSSVLIHFERVGTDVEGYVRP
jgi:hypothetical protein